MSRHRGIVPAGHWFAVGLSPRVIGLSTEPAKPLLINHVGTIGSPGWVPDRLINSGWGESVPGSGP